MECIVCDKPANNRCSRCKVTYYCDRLCQKKDYPVHVLSCPLRTADTLVRNAFDDLMPTKMAVLYEYGFTNCKNIQERTMLLGVYIGLIRLMSCSASQLHSWWENGELVLNIKKTYEDQDPKHTSEYYRWFLKNQHLLQDLRKYEGEKTDKLLADKYNAKIKSYLSERDQTIPVKSLPESKQRVVEFYLPVLLRSIPRVEQQNWIDFGFCTCKFGRDYFGEDEEVRLGKLYQELIIQKGCKIDEFNDAYVSGSVLDLLKNKCGNCSWLTENRIGVHGYSQPVKSVYYLKQYVLSESVDLKSSVKVDYGFENCRTENEIRKLKNMYRKLIKASQFDPRDLHNACMAGKIFDYVSSILPNEVLNANLLKNPYPLEKKD